MPATGPQNRNIPPFYENGSRNIHSYHTGHSDTVRPRIHRRHTQRGNDVIRQTPFKRFGKAEELCGTIQYLISDASSFVTGTVAVVDGGFNAFAM